jgi:hypothetical protein
MRDVLWQALVDRLRGASRIHVAGGILQALDPASSVYVDWQAELLRRQASGLELTEAASRRAALARYQMSRTRRKLGNGN